MPGGVGQDIIDLRAFDHRVGVAAHAGVEEEVADVLEPARRVGLLPRDNSAQKGFERRRIGEAREQRQRLKAQRGDARVQKGVKLEDIFSQIQAGEVATLNIVLKADVQGSLEAVTESLRRLERDEVKLAFVHRAVGGITDFADGNKASILRTSGGTTYTSVPSSYGERIGTMLRFTSGMSDS